MAIACFLLVLQFEGCYYMQAARGQMGLMNKQRPINEVIADEESPEALKTRLIMVQEARQFSVNVLQLPDNKSYRSYADLERDYVVWNVFAAPEFSLTPKQWCYPVAGCVAYRGYFSEDAAVRQSQKLIDKGFDTTVGGVAAYSTLGKFSDPLLNTMMRWSDVDLIATLFHELAHQKLYVKGDTAFNESFATAVADIGIEKWLAAIGQPDQLESRRSTAQRRHKLMILIDQAKSELKGLYASGIAEADMRQQKRQILDRLSREIRQMVADTGGGSKAWLPGSLNNARLASLGLYEDHVDAFKAVFDECEQDFACFYRRTEVLAAMEARQREEQLQRLAAAGMDQNRLVNH
jgi:predicted aminopeptidase